MQNLKNGQFLAIQLCFINSSKVEVLFKNDQKLFEQIRTRYLTERCLISNFETQIKEIVHNVWNVKNNQKKNFNPTK